MFASLSSREPPRLPVREPSPFVRMAFRSWASILGGGGCCLSDRGDKCIDRETLQPERVRLFVEVALCHTLAYERQSRDVAPLHGLSLLFKPRMQRHVVFAWLVRALAGEALQAVMASFVSSCVATRCLSEQSSGTAAAPPPCFLSESTAPAIDILAFRGCLRPHAAITVAALLSVPARLAHS